MLNIDTVSRISIILLCALACCSSLSELSHCIFFFFPKELLSSRYHAYNPN